MDPTSQAVASPMPARGPLAAPLPPFSPLPGLPRASPRRPRGPPLGPAHPTSRSAQKRALGPAATSLRALASAAALLGPPVRRLSPLARVAAVSAICLTCRAHMSAPLLPQPRPLPFLCQVGPTRQAVASPTQRVPLCSPGPTCRIHPFLSFSRASARAHRRESRHACALHRTDAQIPPPTLTRTPRPHVRHPHASAAPNLARRALAAPPRRLLCATADRPRHGLPAPADHLRGFSLTPGASPRPPSPIRGPLAREFHPDPPQVSAAAP